MAQSPDDHSDDEADKEEGEVEAGATTEESKSKEERLEARREQRRQNEAQAIARLRLLGNMQFVGHLFKKKMLTEKIMHFCIQDLLTEVCPSTPPAPPPPPPFAPFPFLPSWTAPPGYEGSNGDCRWSPAFVHTLSTCGMKGY